MLRMLASNDVAGLGVTCTGNDEFCNACVCSLWTIQHIHPYLQNFYNPCICSCYFRVHTDAGSAEMQFGREGLDWQI